MKTKLIALIGLAALCVQAQPTNPPLIVLPTNAPTPVKETESVLQFLSSQATNWYWATYGIYDSGTHSFGAGVAAAYALNEFMAPTIRLDWINAELWQPSGTFELQYPLKLMGGKMYVVPFGFGGIATPISGQGESNGRITDIYGFGLAVRLPTSGWWPHDIVMDWEQWGSLHDNQYRFGFLWKF